jgi:hypothetical protein
LSLGEADLLFGQSCLRARDVNPGTNPGIALILCELEQRLGKIYVCLCGNDRPIGTQCFEINQTGTTGDLFSRQGLVQFGDANACSTSLKISNRTEIEKFLRQ